MKFNASRPDEIKFSREKIYEEVQKILEDPGFASSVILKRFLLFIIEQTLLGQSIQIKEYTIAVSVLNKPKSFRPQENGIVRIHARRLRQALNNYYERSGHRDQVRIFIPRGSYIPEFVDNTFKTIKENTKNFDWISTEGVVGVIPFTHLNNKFINPLADGLCIQLSSELAHIEKFSIVAYLIMRNLFKKTKSTHELGYLTGAQYVIAGNIQSIDGQLRVNVQLVETDTGLQLWSNIYQRAVNSAGILELQDEIASLVVSELGKFFSSLSAHQLTAAIA